MSSVRVSVQRSSNNQWWTGSGWSNTQQSVLASGTTSWNTTLATSQLSNGVTYTVTSWTIDVSGQQSANSVRTLTYDTTAPTVATNGIVTANKNGLVEANVDTFSVTFNEALDPTSVPTSATLTLSKSGFSSTTNYGISGLTNGLMSTGSGNYWSGTSFSTRSATWAGTLALSNDNQTVTFTVTGPCVGSSCSSMSSSTSNGGIQFRGATTLRDLAGNAPTTSTFTTSPTTVLF